MAKSRKIEMDKFTPTELVYYTSQAILENNNLPFAVNNVLFAYTGSSKNIYNAALFEIRQLISAYQKTEIEIETENAIKIENEDNNTELKKKNLLLIIK